MADMYGHDRGVEINAGGIFISFIYIVSVHFTSMTNLVYRDP